MAVYTAVPPPELRRFLGGYDIGELVSLEGITEGVENSNFRVETTSGPFILTIYEKRVERADLPFFLGLMEHLAERGVPCPLPVHDRRGLALQELRGKPAAIVSFLEGRSARRVVAGHCRALGAVLASLHRAAADFPLQRPNALSLQGWRDLVAACAPLAERIEPTLGRLLTAELAHLQAVWPSGLPEGIIHADLFTDNAFFTGTEVSGVIDFYFACNDLLAYDLAICLNAWCFEADHGFNVTKARALLEGYTSRRSLQPAELKALPVLARGAALRFLLTRLYDWLHQVEGARVRPKDPREFLAKLRFHQAVTGPEAYGIG